MDGGDVDRIVRELKNFHLIDPNREILEKANVYCNFSAKKSISAILYDPNTLNFLNESEVLWILLHEESHLTHNQERERRESHKSIINFILAIVMISSMMILSPKNLISNLPYFLSLAVVSYITIIAIVSYIDTHYFYQPYYKDEFEADECAVKGLFIIKPDLVAYQIMYSSFRAFKKCRESGKRPPILLKLYLKLTAKPHPPETDRVRKARMLYNKFETNRRTATKL